MYSFFQSIADYDLFSICLSIVLLCVKSIVGVNRASVG